MADLRTTIWQRIGLVLFGLFLALFVLELGMRLSGFLILSFQNARNGRPAQLADARRILCLGESTTQRGYPQLLSAALNQNSAGVEFKVVNRGVGGIDTNDILSGLEGDLDKYRPEMVVVMMGVNDESRDMSLAEASSMDIAGFLKSFKVYKLVALLGLHIRSKFQECFISGESRNVKAPAGYPEYMALAEQYKTQGKLESNAEALRRAIELSPGSVEAYALLGRCYRKMGRFLLSEEALNKAIALAPGNAEVRRHLGKTFFEQGKFAEAEEAYRKSIELDSGYANAYFLLGMTYQEQRKFALAEEAYKKVIVLDPAFRRTYGTLWSLYEEMGEKERAKEYYDKSREFQTGYGTVTARNYQQLKRTLDARGIRLVAVQYPMRDIAPLKHILAGDDRVLFVDNERVFKGAVEKEGYREYFVDVFAGDFGHCTLKGDRLLAQNIARAILNELLPDVKVYGR